MFVVNEDLSIYATRGDIVCLNVSAKDDRTGEAYEFQPGDIVQMMIYRKKNAEDVVMQKDFPVPAKTDTVGIFLTEQDTKIGDTISKPTDYWYQVTLNPYTNPQTFIGYDEDGAKIFKLFPEGKDITNDEPTKPEDIPVVDEDLSLLSSRPVENRAIARAITLVKNDMALMDSRLTGKIKENKKSGETVAEELAVEKARLDNLIAQKDVKISQALGYIESISAETKAKIDGIITSDGVFATIEINLREANLFYGGTTVDMFTIPKECRPMEVGLVHTEDGLEYRINYDGKRYYMSLTATETVAPSGAGTVTMSYALGDYELKDVRVGYNGEAYGSAGTAIRAQMNRVQDEVNGIMEGEPFNRLPAMGVRLGKFENDGAEGIATTTCITNTYRLLAGDKIQIIDTDVVESVVLYDENGARLEAYSALVDNRALLVKEDVAVRMHIICGADPDKARLVVEKAQDYVSVTRTPHIKSEGYNILSDVTLTMGKFHTGLGYEIDDALSVRTNEVVELKKGMVIALHGVGMTMNAYTPDGRAFQNFRSPNGAFGAITNGRSPYEVKNDMTVRLVFNATTEEQAAEFLANPELYVQIFDPNKIPACFQSSALASAATISDDAELIAHCVSACTCNSKVYAVYYASEENAEESVSNTTIKIYLKEFSITNPANGKRILLCESGHAFNNFKQASFSAPYDPQIVKVGDTELRIFFTAHDESGNSSVGYVTYNPSTGEIGNVFNKLQIAHNGNTYAADRNGWERLFADTGIALERAPFMCGTCKIIKVSDKYYTVLFSCSDGDKGVLLESVDLLNWSVVSFIATDNYIKCTEASIEYNDGVFYAFIRGENGMHFGTYNGEVWKFTHVSTVNCRPLILRTENNDLVGFYNTNESRQSFVVADIVNGVLVPRVNVFVGSRAHYFDYIRVGGNVWLFYSSDVKGVGNGRSSVQCAPIDLNNGLFPY